MLDDFFVRALLAGVGVAVFAAPLGCFVVWRRMAYFGDTIAHAGLLGAAMAFAFNIDISIGIVVVAALIALALVNSGNKRLLPTDTMLGIFSHAALSIGLIVLGLMSGVRVDLNALLFGDILSVNTGGLVTIWLGGAVVLLVLAAIWRPLLAATVSPEIASAESSGGRRVEAVFLLLIAIVVAISVKVVGVLLVTSLLVIPAASARSFARSPEAMAIIAALFGLAAVLAGLFASLRFDTASGPSIVVAAFALFVLTLLARRGQ